MQLLYSRHHHSAEPVGAPALAIRDLVVGYPGVPVPAVRSVSLELPAGVRAALVGANGSGKSTLLKAVAGLLRPTSGSIQVYGLPLSASQQRVAYLPQRGEIDWRFPITVAQLVLAGRYVHLGWLRRPGRADRLLVAEVLDRLGLGELAQRQIGRLSGGQQQRALLARALVQEAKLLLLDEPLSAVDADSRAIIAGLLDQLRCEGRSALVATHHLDRLDQEFDAVFALADGAILAGYQPPLLELV